MKRDDWNQEKYERLTQMMAGKGVGQEAFELLADLATSRRLALETKAEEPSGPEIDQIFAARDERIRLECVSKIEELRCWCVNVHPSDYESGVLDGYNEAIDAIMGEAKK